MFKDGKLMFTVRKHMFIDRKHKFTGLEHKKEQKVEENNLYKENATSLHEVAGRIRYGYEREFRRSRLLIPAKRWPYHR